MSSLRIRTPQIHLLASIALSLATTSCRYLTAGTTISAEVGEGSKFCSVAKIPNWDSVVEGDRLGLSLLYRKPSLDRPAGSGILLSAEKRHLGQEVAVSEKYWIDPERRTIRVATDADWEAGQALGFLTGSPGATLPERKPGRNYAEDRGTIIKDRRDTIWGSRHFAHSRDISWLNYIAPGDRFIALGSFNGYSAQGRFALADSFFIDVYEVASGKRLALINGFWKQWSPDIILLQMRWLSDRDLVFPFGEDTRDLLICRFGS